MARFVSVFISPTHTRLMVLIVWLLTFAVALGAFGVYSIFRVNSLMGVESRRAGDQFLQLQHNIGSAFAAVQRDLTAAPCSEAYHAQLRRIAYRPDGLSQFLYAPGGKVECALDKPRFDPALDLGPADIAQGGTNGFGSLWIDRDLSFLGLEDTKGSILLAGGLAVVIPPHDYGFAAPEWMSVEAVLVSQDGRRWHRGGTEGVYESVLPARQESAAGRYLSRLDCDSAGLNCIAVEANLLGLMNFQKGPVAILVLLAALIAAIGAHFFSRYLTYYWSFEARFCRYLDEDSVICMYQPVMALDTGEITGCEVLARWRDVDDSIVFPDRFIEIIERKGLTQRFTEMVAKRACAELSTHLPAGRRLQVNFNVFPRDLDADDLTGIYSGFISQPNRFDVVLEIIESDEIPPNAQREIERLRRHGVKTYIDDFGTGYSNMQNVAALSVDGVKLDRAFAMAPDNSMMARMLRHAVDMIQATGRVMVVEGVETADRLAQLRAMQAKVDFVQGYLISRPLDIVAFTEFLRPDPVSLAERRARAGLGIVAA